MAGFPWNIEPFDNKRHNRRSFDCGNAMFDDSLGTKVNQFEKKELARAYVLAEMEELIVCGYYTLSSHTVVYDALPKDQAKGLPKIDVPVALLGRLAVCSSVQGQGLGEHLLLDALRRAEYLAGKVDVQAVEVNAIDDSAQQFYERYVFVVLRDTPNHRFLPIKAVRKLRLPPL